MSNTPESIFRVDKFDVPTDAQEAFLSQIRQTHARLDEEDGCLQNHILVQESGPGRFNVVTVVEWRDQSAYQKARANAEARRRESGFDASKLFSDLGISADIANYTVFPHR